MIWTAQELIQIVKEDIGIRDLPSFVSDKDLLDRMINVPLKEFSLIYPRKENFNIGREDLVDPQDAYVSRVPGVRYLVPKYITMQYHILSILHVTPLRVNGYTDLFWPQGASFAADDVMLAISGIKASAAVGQNMVNALTFDWDSTRKWITIYSGWATASYTVTASIMHDPSLSTIPDTAMMSFKDLVTYDLGAYMYNIIKRKNKLDVGTGSIDLGIDELSDYRQKKQDLLEKLSEDSNLDQDYVEWW